MDREDRHKAMDRTDRITSNLHSNQYSNMRINAPYARRPFR